MFKHRKIPVILQSEISECGLASLCMLMNYHGSRVDLSSLRKQNSIPLSGMSALDIKNIAKKYRLNATVYRLELENIHTLKLPVILHWDMNHFVVLTKIKKKSLLIHDPSLGKLKLSKSEFSLHFTGIAIELEPAADYQNIRLTGALSLKNLLANTPKIKSFLFYILIASFLLQVSSIIAPQFIQLTVDHLSSDSNFNYIIFLGLIFAGLKLLEACFSLARSILVNHLGNKLSQFLGESVFEKLLKLPISFFAKRHIGDVISRFNSIDKIRSVISQGLVSSLVDGLMSITTLIILYRYSFLLGNIAFGCSSFYFLLRLFTARISRLANEKLIKQQANQNSHFIETLRGIQAIKLFGKESLRFTAWQQRLGYFLTEFLNTNMLQSSFNSLKTVISGLESILIIFLGALLIMEHRFSLGMLYAFIFYRQLFDQSVSGIIDSIFDYRILSIHVERLADIIVSDNELAFENSIDPQIKINFIFSLRAENIAYAYANETKTLFENVNFEIKTGETVAFKAPSGFGKTTLLKILMGLLEPTAGRILVNEIPLNHIKLRSFRGKIAAVMQEDSLFSGSLLQNIAFFDEKIDIEKVTACAKRAGIHNEIMAMPMGYHSLVGDMGTVLSGGQKQRILLARALYADPQVLFLDESTSHLDQNKEMEINHSLKSLGMIKIIAAHRSETLASADRIIDLSVYAKPNQKNPCIVETLSSC